MNEPRVRVPLDGWNTDERRRLRALAAGAQIDIRWEGDAAVFVGADDEARLRDLVASIRPAGRSGARSLPSHRSRRRVGSARRVHAELTGDVGDRPDRPARVPLLERDRVDRARGRSRHPGRRSLTDASRLGPPIAPPPGAYPGTLATTGTAPSGGPAPERYAVPSARPDRGDGPPVRRVLHRRVSSCGSCSASCLRRSRRSGRRRRRCVSPAVPVRRKLRIRSRATTASSCRSATRLRSRLRPTVAISTLRFIVPVLRHPRRDGRRDSRQVRHRDPRREGRRILQGVPKSLVRWIVFAVDGPLSLFLCGIITSATSRGHRRLGDMSAQTYVVAKDAVGHPIEVS